MKTIPPTLAHLPGFNLAPSGSTTAPITLAKVPDSGRPTGRICAEMLYPWWMPISIAETPVVAMLKCPLDSSRARAIERRGAR